LTKHYAEQDSGLLILESVKSDRCDIKLKKKMCWKVKNLCCSGFFFIWIVIKNYWCDLKSEKKLECFDVNWL